MVVLTLGGKPIDWQAAKRPDPTMLVQWKPDHGSISKMYKASLRTCAHQDQMDNRAFVRFGTGISIFQPPYNTSVPQSAGTHDYDAMRDWWIPGVDWWIAQRFGRECGEFVWYRYPPAFSKHLHGGTLPIPRKDGYRGDDFATRVGIFVPGQLVDYYNHAFGLANKHTPGSDKSWYPKSIDATVFDFNHYIVQQREKTMQYQDWSAKSKKMLVDDVVAGIMGAKVQALDGAGRPKQITVRAALARAANGVVVTRQSEEDVKAAIAAADSDN